MRLIDAEGSELQTQLKIIREAEYQIYGSGSWGFTAKCEHAIEDAPTVQSELHWIPCSKRLPETTDAVLTTYIVNGDRSRRYVEESSYYGNDGSWSSPWDEYRMPGTSIEVIAWMPMPAPWKGE